MPPINILLVDDRPANLLALRAVLEPLGENLLEAASGEAALQLAARHELAAILLDVQMPGMNGFETAARLRTLHPDRRTPILFVTAAALEEASVARGYALGAVDYVLKPFTAELLRHKVAAHTEAFRRTQALETRLQEIAPTTERPAVLVVNDEPAALTALVAALEGLDCEVLSARSASAALGLLLQKDLALILLDFHMPGMSGLEMARLVKQNERFQHTPIIFVSATTSAAQDVEQGYAAGAMDFLFVPIPPELLRARVQAFLDQFSHQRQLARQVREIERLNAALLGSKQHLQTLNATLERRVAEQTAALQETAEELRRKNASLAASDELHRRLIETAQEGVWMVDEQERTVLVNPRMAGMLGYTVAEMLGQHPDAFLPEAKKGEPSTRLAQNRKGEIIRFEAEFLRRDGQRVICLGSAAPLLNPERRYAGSVALFTDITEAKELEARFLRAQRLESLGALAGGIAHDLNNVLAPILMVTSLLQDEIPDEESRNMIELVKTNALRGADIIKQVLTFARGVKGERVPLQLKHLLRDMAHIIRETFPKLLTLEMNLAPDLWTVTGDATQLHQVLMNLCVNARDAMTEGGLLHLSARNVHLDEAMVRMLPDAQPGPHVLLSVADTGPGIPPEILDRIFDPFFTTKQPGQGTGLGLSTVLGIVRTHGGIVQVQNAAEGGARFDVYLPASTEQVSETAGLPPEWGSGQGELILVVDDEPALRGVAKMILERHGYQTLFAANGAEALALFAQHRETVRAVLCDMAMPVMAGPVTVRGLRQIEPRLRVIGMTGNEQQFPPGTLEQLNLQGRLTKPFSAAQLLAALAAALHPEAAAPGEERGNG